MKAGRKIAKRLEARLKGHAKLLSTKAGRTVYDGQYTAPGSRKGKGK